MTRAAGLSLLIALLVVAGGRGGVPVRAQGGLTPSAQERARRFIANHEGLPIETLRLVHVRRIVNPETTGAAFAVKIVDTTTGRTYSLLVDDGGVGSLSRPPRPFTAALRARHTKIDTTLNERASGGPAGQTLPVVLWLKARDSVPAARPSATRDRDALASEAAVRTTSEAVDRYRAAAVAPIVEPIAARLRARGRVPRTYRYSPAVSVNLSEADLREVAAWPEVDGAYLDVVNEPEMDIARTSLKASIVNNRGYSGTGVRIAMVEVGGRIAANASLELTQDVTYICSSASTHSTGVAGLINSVHPTARGIAPGALLWAGGSCSGLSSQLQDRSSAAADWGARAVNLSWGASASLVPGATERFFDDMVLNRHLFVVKSAGNRAGPCQGDAKITSPGLGYNLLTVGGYDDRNTTDWNDDIMDDCSSYVDPVSANGDREKPEVVAPSMNITSTLTTGGVGNIGSGTSWASGMVTGVAALLMQRAPALQFWPEALKAILMATAVHNIEGDRRLSDQDGAGGLSVDRADDVVRGFRGGWNAQTFDCDAITPVAPIDVPMSLIANRRTRAVIVWDTDPNYELYAEQPGADIDISVLDPSSTVVATSASLDNTYEIVDFLPALDGQYTLRITTTRCDASPRYLAWAWWRAG